MLLDYWTAAYAEEIARGTSSFEATDDEWDAEAILAALENEPGDQWEDMPQLGFAGPEIRE